MTAVSIDTSKKLISVNGSLDKHSIEHRSAPKLTLTTGEIYTLDLNSLVDFDSAGLAYLVNLISKQRLAGGDINMVNCPNQVRQLIELSELDHILDIKTETD